MSTVERSEASFPGGQPGCTIRLPVLLHRDAVEKLPNISPVERLYRFMWRRKVSPYKLLACSLEGQLLAVALWLARSARHGLSCHDQLLLIRQAFGPHCRLPALPTVQVVLVP